MTAQRHAFNSPVLTRLSAAEAAGLAVEGDLVALMAAAAARRDAAHGDVVTYSPKVFIPLTKLCRDVCHYCTFAKAPRKGERAYLAIEEAIRIAAEGKAQGCTEALFTLGDKPEARYGAAREELASLGHASTLSYLREAAQAVFAATGLFPHLNPGLMTAEELADLREVSLSQGLMLEALSDRLSRRGGPHFGSPDKCPKARLGSIEAAGKAAVSFTTGLLIGIGETRQERIEALLALRDLHDRYGHIQEIIIQNFRPKPGTRMAHWPAAGLDEQLWTVAVTRLIFPAAMNIQSPPNLQPTALRQLIGAGINDWGGVSPVTPDHVNPEAPWPRREALQHETEAAGKRLQPRLPLYPTYARDIDRWVAPGLRASLLKAVDTDGWPRGDAWLAGASVAVPQSKMQHLQLPVYARSPLAPIIAKAQSGAELSVTEIAALFRARDGDFGAVCAAADELRRTVNGDAASYVVTRNINYTNICTFKCRFCAFSKGKTADHLRGKPYDLTLTQISAHVREAWARGATEVCMQGGIHPDYTGAKYLEICRTVKAAAPGLHIHAFSPLEIHQGAATLGLPLGEYLTALREAGLGSLPGTAAEILHDEVRAVLCPDKIGAGRWIEIMRAAHRAGLRSTATIMFGHIDRYEHWAHHILLLRRMQSETGGFTEMVPLPFVHMEAPLYLKGQARRGPTFRESVLMHAVCRLALHPHIPNIQASWVKMGPDGLAACLGAGANDMGGTLMCESITRSAGASHGQEMTPQTLQAIARGCGRTPRQRTTLYGDVRRD